MTGRSSPIDPAIVQRAAEWMARLLASDVSEADRLACANWRSAHPDHERAWQHLAAIDGKLREVPAEVAQYVLRSRRPSPMRRRVLGLAGAAAAGALVYGLREDAAAPFSLRVAFADYRTSTGDIREHTLPDGTRVVLDTASAIDVHYGAQARRISLLAGRILVHTAKDRSSRPFYVDTAQGSVQALGTVFSVQRAGPICRVSVHEGAVEIRPANAAGLAVQARAGQHADFSADHVTESTQGPEDTPAWSRGLMVASDMRLADLLGELSRYRRGVLRCDPTVAEMRVTGVFPLRDTDRALHNLTVGLPLRLSSFSPYWVTVTGL
ncbi:hypothetical protein CDO44_04870 [Pigmentiphaga sp. NML080357]|uniref:FecR domain-containing protein n=1 Tax=Pigmentiphaga sp. NML080357 TaxID=2008675 RepID=UPI000B412FE5|nr:FecR domain-containing protein [Pigmentiphaga sp. NML080357]OVZ62182.1 hypothetical protein CDO44_04870 [Pigmentiphaga sp. NML080357]